MAVYSDNSVNSIERRQHVRWRVNTLAYVDIATDNGGIALNLSEEGMAFQAVAPPASQTSLSLRIQLPDSRTWIKTEAQIVWIRESTEVGVRFVDLPSEARAQIQEWTRSQISPNVPSQGIFGPREAGSELPKTQAAVRETRKDKWLTIAKLREQELANPTSKTEVTFPEKHFYKPVAHEAASVLPSSTSSVGDLPERAVPMSSSPGPSDGSPQDKPTTFQSPTKPLERAVDSQTNGQNGDATAVTVPSTPQADPDWTVPAIRDALLTTASLSTPALPSPEPVPSDFASTASWAPVAVRAIPSFAEAARSARKWAEGAVFFVLISILCFSIGTWVGSRGTRVHSVQMLAEPAIAMPVTEAKSERNGPKAGEFKSATASKSRPEHVIGDSVPQNENRNTTLVRISPLAQPVQRDVQPLPAESNLTPLVAPVPLVSGSAPAPTPDNSGVIVPAPRLVAGRILRPTDRFNECHLIYRVEPAYPPEARQQLLEGAVKIHLIVGADGKVRNMQVLSGPALLVPAAMDAAKFWEYLPALLNGQPVETEQDIEIDFRLPH